jgi:phospholipid transport system substrate-binding protein
MKVTKRPSRYMLLAVSLLFGLAAVAARAQDAPDAIIKKAVDDVTASIAADKDIQAGNRQKIMALVDSKIVPYVSMRKMTQSAVGPNWPKATPEQQQQLIQQFKVLVVNAYAGAFTNYKSGTKIEYKPFRMAAGDTDAVVRSTIATGNGDPIPVDYYLEKGDNGWKVIDLGVYNARLVELYKGQFNSAISSGGIDGLIKTLTAKNQSAGNTVGKG